MSHAVAISELKAKCTGLVARVKATGRPLVVTKNGKPIARVVPFQADAPIAGLRGSVVSYGDILSPTGEKWNAAK